MADAATASRLARGQRLAAADADEGAHLHRAHRRHPLLLADRPDFPVDRQPDPDVEARRAQRLPGHGHDLRHHHRRHRPLGRLDRRPVRHGGRLSGAQRHRPADRLHGLFQRARDHPHHARRRHPDRRDQRTADHPAQRRAFHRHARHALRRARRGTAVVRRPHLPESRRQSRPRQHRLRLSRRRAHPRPAGVGLAAHRGGARQPPISPATRRSAAISSPSAATSARRASPASASTWSRCSSTCSPASARRSSASSSPPS